MEIAALAMTDEITACAPNNNNHYEGGNDACPCEGGTTAAISLPYSI